MAAVSQSPIIATNVAVPARAASSRPLVIDAETRAQSFGKARRHTVFVKLMRRLLPVICLGLVVGYGLAAVKTKFKVGNGELTAGPIIIDTEKLEMLNPKYNGFGKDGSSYDVTAASAQQDLQRTGPILLKEIDGVFNQINDNRIKLKADRGRFDQKADTLELQDRIVIRGDDGMKADLTQATITMKEHKIVSSQPVQIQMAAGTINGQNMVLLQEKREVYFDDGVIARLRPEPKVAKEASKSPPAPAASATKTGPSLMGNSDAPVDITAKSLKVDDNAKVATFTTGVVAKQGAATLETNELQAFYDGQPLGAAGGAASGATAATPAQAEANTGKLKRLVSKGDVVLTQGADRVTSNGADFDAVTEKAILTGNVVMMSIDRRATSDRADLDTKADAAVLTGNVVISSGVDQQAKSDRADLNNKAETALLTGNVIVDQGRNRLQGRRLTADRKVGNMTLSSPAEPGLPADRIAARFYQNEATPGQAPVAAKAAAAPQADGGGWTFRTDPGAPIDITSEVLNVVDKKHTATFTGAVHAVQGEFTIKTPELVATYTGQAALAGAPRPAVGATATTTAPAPGAQLQKIRANGKVEVTSSNNRSATGDWAEFDVKGNRVTIGAAAGKHAELKDGRSVAICGKVIIDMVTGLTVCEQETRVASPAAARNPEFRQDRLPDLITDPTIKTKAVAPGFAANPSACQPGRQCMMAFPQDGKAGATPSAAKASPDSPAAASPAPLPWATTPAKPTPQPVPKPVQATN
jgi:hypothetical protein